MKTTIACVGLMALLLSACSNATTSDDPLARQPDTSEGLINVSSDLMAVLEEGSLRGACDSYWAAVEEGADTPRARLLCGKEMFFYEGFDTLGVPTSLLTTMLELFPEQLGPGAEGVGMVLDPTSDEDLPLGFGPGKDFAEGVPALAFTCASCHFGKLPDGRYSVGAPNHDYDYGEMNLAIAVVPLTALVGLTPEPTAAEKLAPYLQAMEADPTIQIRLLAALAPLAVAGGELPQFTDEIQAAYASWKSGTMDFLIEPLPIEDEVHTVSKIMPLWGIPNDEEVAQFEMDGALLGQTGVATSLANFLRGFVVLGAGDSDTWNEERLAPLEDYILSLRAPENPDPPDAGLVNEGRSLFGSLGCTDCHDGARGSSRRVYSFEEIGSDDAMKRWMDPDLDKQPCCEVDLLGRDELTHGLRAQRLVGLWSAKRFLHNGSVDSLEDLFCLDGPRPTVLESPWSDRGHMFTCDGLSQSEKLALIAYLRSLD